MVSVALPCGRDTSVRLFFFERKVNVVVFALATDTQSSGLDAREDDSDEFTKGCWVERYNPLSPTATSVLRVDSVPRHRSFSRFAYSSKPRNG